MLEGVLAAVVFTRYEAYVSPGEAIDFGRIDLIERGKRTPIPVLSAAKVPGGGVKDTDPVVTVLQGAMGQPGLHTVILIVSVLFEAPIT
jgi:hypothetical protein